MVHKLIVAIVLAHVCSYEHIGVIGYVFCVKCMESWDGLIECSAGANVWLMALITIEATCMLEPW